MFSRGLQRWRQMAGPSCPRAFQASVSVTIADMPLAKPIPTSEPGVTMRGLQGYIANKQNAWIQQEGREWGQRTIYWRALAPYQHFIPSPRWQEDTCCLKLRVSQVTKLWLPWLPCCWHGKEYQKKTQEWNRWEKATPVEIRRQYYWN